jgi:PAP2 superfamily
MKRAPILTVSSGAGLLAAVAIALSPGFYEQTVKNIFFSLTLASVAIVFISARPLREFCQLMVTTAGLIAAQVVILDVPFKVSSVLAVTGLSALLLLGIRRIWAAEAQEAQLLHYAFLPSLLFVLLGYSGSVLLEITGRLHPKTYDAFLYDFDLTLGLQLSFRAGQVLLASSWLTRLAVVIYYALPLVLMFVYARLLVRDKNAALTAFLAFVIAGPVGVVFYNLVPACGPIYLFGTRFPFESLSSPYLARLPLQALPLAGARNAFPSLHMAWALLAYWYSRELPVWARATSLLFLTGTAIVTLGLGEHYFVDLVTAVPFALMIRAACAFYLPALNPRRLMSFLTGLISMLFWVVLLRAGLPSGGMNSTISWCLVVATIVSSIFLEARMQTLGV